MSRCIHQLTQWPNFTWDHEAILPLLSNIKHKQGRLKGYMEVFGFSLRNEATLQALTLDVLKSSEIEGEILNQEQVCSSVARRLGIDIAGLVPPDRHVEGVVEMMLDATQNYQQEVGVMAQFKWYLGPWVEKKYTMKPLRPIV